MRLPNLPITRPVSWRRLAPLALASAGGAALVLLVLARTPTDPLAIISAWNSARNAGDVDLAISYLDDEANVFGASMRTPDGRAFHRGVLEAQAIAGHHVEDSECTMADPFVHCRYVQQDAFLTKCGLRLTGMHHFRVVDGKIVLVSRKHDEESQEAVYSAIGKFRGWVEATRPEAVAVIWSDRNSVFYTTADGATTMLTMLDDYDCRAQRS